MLSLFAVGGAITTAPDMHRYVVDEHHWISDAQFTASIAIAQAAPGPNVLFVAILGWNVAGPLGAIATMCRHAAAVDRADPGSSLAGARAQAQIRAACAPSRPGSRR